MIVCAYTIILKKEKKKLFRGKASFPLTSQCYLIGEIQVQVLGLVKLIYP